MLPYFIDGMTADAVLLNRSNPVLAADPLWDKVVRRFQ
jgi:hypothetical protein